MLGQVPSTELWVGTSRGPCPESPPVELGRGAWGPELPPGLQGAAAGSRSAKLRLRHCMIKDTCVGWKRKGTVYNHAGVVF